MQHCPVPLIQRCISSHPKDNEVKTCELKKEKEKECEKKKTLFLNRGVGCDIAYTRRNCILNLGINSRSTCLPQTAP